MSREKRERENSEQKRYRLTAINSAGNCVTPYCQYRLQGRIPCARCYMTVSCKYLP